jgi:hypothetical protein
VVDVLAARVRWLILLATVAVLAAGIGACRPDPPLELSPEPAPRYQPVPRDLCTRLRVEDLAERFDLTLVPWYEPRTDYSEPPGWWAMSCSFPTLGGADQFTTIVGGLDPRGSVSVKVYRDPEDAAEQYLLDTGSYQERQPDAPAASIEGWWDEGMSGEIVEPVPQGSHPEDPHASHLRLTYFIYHRNLLLEADLDGWSANGEVDEARDALYEIMDAFIEETFAHLTLIEN